MYLWPIGRLRLQPARFTRYTPGQRQPGGAAMPTTRTPCNVLGKKHDWKERDEKYSSYSSQSVGSVGLPRLWNAVRREAERVGCGGRPTRVVRDCRAFRVARPGLEPLAQWQLTEAAGGEILNPEMV